MAEAETALEDAHERIDGLKKELESTNQQRTDLEEEVRSLREKVKEERDKNRVLWGMHCEKLAEYDELIVARGEDVRVLERQIAALGPGTSHSVPRAEFEHGAVMGGRAPSTCTLDRTGSRRGVATDDMPVTTPPHVSKELVRPSSRDVPRDSYHGDSDGHTERRSLSFSSPSDATAKITGEASPVSEGPRRGKAPVDQFSGEVAGIGFDDWYPSLQRAANWNKWTDHDAIGRPSSWPRPTRVDPA